MKEIEVSEPLVSISCITYNHEKYIESCLEGLLMQKTDFRYEILIHDDASTDNTQDIILRYQQKYPQIIKPIFQTENQYSKGIRPNNFNYDRAKGKYIALCEGDDYWIDPYKLQKQVDILERDESIGLVYSNAYIFNQTKKRIFKKKTKAVYNLSDILENTVSTLTTCFRKDLLYEYLSIDMPIFSFGDYPMWLYFLSKSKFYLLEEFTAVYRLLEESASHSKDVNKVLSFIESVHNCQFFFINNYFPLEKERLSKIELNFLVKKIHTSIVYHSQEAFSIYYKQLKALKYDKRIYYYVFKIIAKNFSIGAVIYIFLYKLYLFFNKKKW